MRKVFLAMVGDKFVGLDGFFMAFFQAFWDVLKNGYHEGFR